MAVGAGGGWLSIRIPWRAFSKCACPPAQFSDAGILSLGNLLGGVCGECYGGKCVVWNHFLGASSLHPVYIW